MQLMLRVGIALDADARNVLAPVVAAVKRAKGQLASDGAAAAKALGDPFMRTAKEVAAAEAAMERRRVAAANKAENDRVKAVDKSAKDRVRAEKAANAEIERDYKRRVSEVEKSAEKEVRIAERAANARKAASKKAGGLHRADVRGIGAGAAAVAGVAGTALGFAARVGLDLARGAGVDFDLGTHIGNNVQLQTRATELSNSGFMAGTAGANGQRQDPAALMKDVQKVAGDTATDTNEVMAGLQSFVGLTGDLETGRQTLKGLAVLSKATGSNFDDMASAAANASNELGDMPNKADAVQKIMQGIAGQGKLGAVEIKDMASQMAKVAAQAGKFEGDIGENILMMGALAQEARAHGGASSAANSATAVGSFAAVFQKGARDKAFKAAGIDIMSKTDKNQYRNPIELIKEVLTKTGGDPTKMNAFFADVASQKVTLGYQQAYNRNGGGTKGLQAVDDEYARVRKSMMDMTEVGDSFAAAMDTDASKAQKLNVAMDELAGTVRANLMPTILNAGTTLAELFGVANPNAGINARAADERASRDLIGKSKGDLSSGDRAKLLGDQTAFNSQRKKLESALEEAKQNVARLNDKGHMNWGNVAAAPGALVPFALAGNALAANGSFEGSADERLAAEKRLDVARMMLEKHNAQADKVDSFLEDNYAPVTQFGYGTDGQRRGRGHGFLGVGEGAGPGPKDPTDLGAIFGASSGATGLPQIGGGLVPLAPTKVDPTTKAVADLTNVMKGEIKVRLMNPKDIGGAGSPKVDGSGQSTDGASP